MGVLEPQGSLSPSPGWWGTRRGLLTSLGTPLTTKDFPATTGPRFESPADRMALSHSSHCSCLTEQQVPWVISNHG